MIGRLFKKRGAETRNSKESVRNLPHWSEIDREWPPHYVEWIMHIKSELEKDYKSQLPPEISKKYKESL